MRVLFITRTHPDRSLGALEMRLHDRLRELSELGHDVLVLTKWSNDPIDFELPDRIEVRSPFKTFRPWEWTRAASMVFSWQPELLHIFDPGLTAIERTISVEMVALTMMDTLRRASRGRSSYRGGLVSLTSDPHSRANVDGRATLELVESSWKRAGAQFIETGWMRATGAERGLQPWDFAFGRALRFVLAGEIGRELPFEMLIDALDVMRTLPEFELNVFLRRTDLTNEERKRLSHAERHLEASGEVAVGRRLKLIDPTELQPGRKSLDFSFDAAVIAGLGLASARIWVERLAMPLVLSERLRPLLNELEQRGMNAQILPQLVSELAPMAQALSMISDLEIVKNAWSQIEHGALAGGRDIAANHVSRIYSQIARTDASS